MKDLVEYIVKALVEQPDEVSVQEVAGEASMILEIRVADEDAGRVIGRGGRVVNAVRAIVQALAEREGKRITIEVI